MPGLRSVTGATPAVPLRRIAAVLIDWLLVLAWAACVAAVGIPLYLGGFTSGMPPTAVNLIADAVLVAPVTVWLARLESGVTQATVGKRVMALKVSRFGSNERISFRRALGRNALKVALPWTIGHAAVLRIVSNGDTDPVPWTTWLLTAAAYLLPALYVASLLTNDGRTPYDRIAATKVAPADEPTGDRRKPGIRTCSSTSD